jgi:hypothetical protein
MNPSNVFFTNGECGLFFVYMTPLLTFSPSRSMANAERWLVGIKLPSTKREHYDPSLQRVAPKPIVFRHDLPSPSPRFGRVHQAI